jgi:sarcosine oxidase, subunit delta
MIILQCPYCREQRTETELTYGGEAHIVRPHDLESVSHEQWTDYLFMRSNVKGLLTEQWCCAFGCGQWFKVLRNTVTHEVFQVVRFDTIPEGVQAIKGVAEDGRVPAGQVGL